MAWLFSSLKSLLSTFHLLNKEAKLVFVGLDAAGKTSLLYTLKEDARMTATQPTLFPTSEQLQLGGCTFNAHDLGGHAFARKVWKNYFYATDAIVFIVDAADQVPGRLETVAFELNQILSDPEFEDVPIAVLGNKIDLPRALTEQELKEVLKLDGQTTGKGLSTPQSELQSRPLEVFMCTVKHKSGYGDAFRWVAQYV